MSVEKYIKDNVKGLAEKVYVAPNIPEKKLNGAVGAMAPGVDPDCVLAVVDTTLFGGAKEGCLFMGDAVYIHALGGKAFSVKLSTIASAEYKCTETIKDNGKVEKKEDVILHYKNDESLSLGSNILLISYKKFADLINGIVEQGSGENDFVTTSQTRPLSMMDVEVKKAYVKMICNYAFSDDDKIVSEEYAEIISLIVRIELEAGARLEIRGYMSDSSNKEDNDVLLKYLEEHVEEGSYDIVRKSLMKDILYIHRKKDKTSDWRGCKFIVDLQSKLGIDNEQINYIISAIKNDEDILAQRKNDSEITKSMKDLASKAGAVGVPLAAIYLSGSVMGISAAGLTSGLATLGMGGLLGFSSMFTGIGVAVLLGVGTYKGVKKVTGLSDLENNKQREMMLQAIIKNSQKSLNYLIEDVNEITEQLRVEIERGLQSEIKIKKISAMLSMLSKGAQVTTDKIQYAESEKIISRLPEKLDKVRLQELTNEATKAKIREFVLSCYVEKQAQKDDGSIQDYLGLNDKLPVNTLEQLYDTFDGIGYFNVKDAAMASAKGAAKNLINSILK